MARDSLSACSWGKCTILGHFQQVKSYNKLWKLLPIEKPKQSATQKKPQKETCYGSSKAEHAQRVRVLENSIVYMFLTVHEHHIIRPAILTVPWITSTKLAAVC